MILNASTAKLMESPSSEALVNRDLPTEVVHAIAEVSIAISLKRIADNLDWAKSVFTSPNAKRVIGLAMAQLEAELSDKLEP
jgi:hypothetical protein